MKKLVIEDGMKKPMRDLYKIASKEFPLKAAYVYRKADTDEVVITDSLFSKNSKKYKMIAAGVFSVRK